MQTALGNIAAWGQAAISWKTLMQDLSQKDTGSNKKGSGSQNLFAKVFFSLQTFNLESSIMPCIWLTQFSFYNIEEWVPMLCWEKKGAITTRIRECSYSCQVAFALMFPAQPLKSLQKLSSVCISQLCGHLSVTGWLINPKLWNKKLDLENVSRPADIYCKPSARLFSWIDVCIFYIP